MVNRGRGSNVANACRKQTLIRMKREGALTKESIKDLCQEISEWYGNKSTHNTYRDVIKRLVERCVIDFESTNVYKIIDKQRADYIIKSNGYLDAEYYQIRNEKQPRTKPWDQFYTELILDKIVDHSDGLTKNQMVDLWSVDSHRISNFSNSLSKLVKSGKVYKTLNASGKGVCYKPVMRHVNNLNKKSAQKNHIKSQFLQTDKRTQTNKLFLHTECQIDSAHRLVGYDGKCAEWHGHTWHLDVFISGYRDQCDKDGILFDFGKIKDVCEIFDHKLINDIKIDGEVFFNDINPTAENISTLIYMLIKREKPELGFQVKLYETKVGKETYCVMGDF